jgi:serine/threonine protein kinase
MSLSTHTISLCDYVRGRGLGRGTTGEVFLGTNTHTHEEVALKVVPRLDDYEAQRSFMREIMVPLDLNLPGIVRLIGFSYPEADNPDEPELSSYSATVASEFMRRGSLGSMIKARHTNRLPPDFGPTEFSKAIIGVAATMNWVHKKAVVHRDIKHHQTRKYSVGRSARTANRRHWPGASSQCFTGNDDGRWPATFHGARALDGGHPI